MGCLVHRSDQIQHGLARLNSTAVAVGMDVRQHVQGHTMYAGYLGEILDILQVVNWYYHSGMTGKGTETPEFWECDRLTRDQDVSEPMFDEHLSLANGANADATDSAASGQLL